MERKELGEKIKSFRGRRGLTQNALAELIDVSFQQIQKYEKGQTNISVERLSRIADAFEIPVTEFFLEETAFYTKGVGGSVGALSPEERELITLFRKIKSTDMKKNLIDHLRNILEIQNKGD